MPRDTAMTSPLRRWAPWRRHVLALFVLMLLWRGLIPEGFMPNFAALKALRWELVVCGPEWQAATARWQAQLALKAAGGQGAGQGNQLGYGHAGHASALAVAGSSADHVAGHFAGHDFASHTSHASHAVADQGLAAQHGEQANTAEPTSAAAPAAPQGATSHQHAELLDASASAAHPDGAAHGDAAQHRAFSCAFALAALQLIDLPPTCTVPDEVRAGWVARVQATPQDAPPTLWVPGPPLGSRAPPAQAASPVIA